MIKWWTNLDTDTRAMMAAWGYMIVFLIVYTLLGTADAANGCL